MIILSFTLLLFSLLLLLNVVVLFCARFSSLYYSVLRCVFRVQKIFLFGGGGLSILFKKKVLQKRTRMKVENLRP